MATPPTSIKVYTFPIDGTKPQLEDLRTIETPILERSYPKGLRPDNQTVLDALKNWAEDNHLVYDLPEGVQVNFREGILNGRYQPNIRLLPDTRTRWKDKEWEGWEKRAAVRMEGRMKGHRIFYLRGKREALGLNKHAKEKVSGEMFLLKVSENKDENGQHFYVDVNLDPEQLEYLVDLISLSSYLFPDGL